MMARLILATGNAHKVEEFARLLEGLPVSIESPRSCGGMPKVEETGTTFRENAQIKAEALHSRADADAYILADDSGLEVDALNGAPGVYSARYAGPKASDQDNLLKLLDALDGVSVECRSARFRCALCLIAPDGAICFFEGHCVGRIAETPIGSEGFGYDPVFIPKGYSESFGKLGEGIKSRLSHRALAIAALRASPAFLL